jgi:hypothetical protein
MHKAAVNPRPRAGDLALIPNLLTGSPLRQITAVEFDAAGDVITGYVIGTARISPAQVTAVFSNILTLE